MDQDHSYQIELPYLKQSLRCLLHHTIEEMNSVGILCLLLSASVGISGKSLPRSPRQADECTPLYVDTAQCSSYWAGQKPPLLVLSFDGFRFNYLNRTYMNNEGVEVLAAPNINRLARCGVWASSGMMPSFPTLTFPNHYSIVTGLYPEAHGIVGNSFYDSDIGASFSLSSPQQTNPIWWKGEPLWYTAKRQGKISATYFWPGSDQTDPIREPNYWLLYDGAVPYTDRMQTVFKWLTLPIDQRPNFVTLYLDEPDHTGHGESPDSPLVVDQIKIVDDQLAFLLDNLEQQGILGCIDIVVLSDHGMAPTPPGEKFLIMNDYVPNIGNDARIYDGVFPTIRPNNDTEEEQNRIAYGLECKDQNMRVYNKWDFPRRHHYAEGNRIPSLLLDMTVGWRAYIRSEYVLPGNHGFDNMNSEMLTLFVAQGPSFQRKLQVRQFHNIELYNLMCAMLDIEPSPNNGTWGALHHMLVSPPTDPPTDPISTTTTLSFPADEATYNDHLQRLKCPLLNGNNNPEIDSTLNLTTTNEQAALLLHTPWGSPQSSNTSNIRMIVSNDYVSEFDISTGLPTWVSYTLKESHPTTFVLQWRLDPRLEKNHSSLCDRLPSGIDSSSTLVPYFAFEKGASVADVAVDSNAIEVSSRFAKYWGDFHDKISQLIAQNGETNVIVGPVRDSESPALFFIVSNCKNSPLAQCPIDQLDQQSFILPTHSKYNRDCILSEDFFIQNLAMLRDVEHVSNLRFFTVLPYRYRVDLLSRTFYASHLLSTPNPSP